MVMLASTAGSAAAQHNVLPDTGGRVYGLVGGGFGDGTFVATGAGAGLRLTLHLGLDIEPTHLSGSGRTEEVAATDPFPGISVFSPTNAAFDDYSFLDHGADDLFPSIRFENHSRDLTRLTVEFPVAGGFRSNGTSRHKTMTLAATEFIRRMLLHVLPPGFHRIRYCGFLANRARKQKLAECRRALQAPPGRAGRSGHNRLSGSL